MAYLGNDLQVAYSTYKNIDDISGSFNGSTTSFALLVGGVAPVPLPLNSQQCLISVGGVIQRPDDTGAEGFRLSGGNIVFSSAPSTGEDFFGVILAGADYVNVGANFPSGSAAVPSITFDSDLDTGIYNSAANNISIATGGTQRLVVDSSGRLGLGTSSPGAVLDVSGSGNLVRLGDGTNTFDVRFKGPNNWAVQLDTSADKFNVQRNGSSLVTVDGAGRLGIGTATVDERLHIVGNFKGVDSSGRGLQIINGATPYIQSLGTSNINDLQILAQTIQFGTGTTYSTSERARIDSSGRLLVGTSSARSNFFNDGSSYTPQLQIEGSGSAGQTMAAFVSSHATLGSYFILAKQNSGSVGGNTVVSNNTEIGVISFQGSDGTEFVQAANITAFVDGTPGANDMPGRLVFSTTADGASSPTERMRISNAGDMFMADGRYIYVNGNGDSPRGGLVCTNTSNNTNATVITFKGWDNSTTGSISTRVNVTTYSTSSDYRLKENIVDLSDATARLQLLKPKRFNFKANPEETIDGFLAHEAQLAVPEAVTGSKDQEDEEGNPIYQGIDLGKLVPLLTASLQESIGRIEALEAEVVALKSA